MTKKEMKKCTCCFTGHRKIPQNEIVKVKTQLRRTVETAIKKGYKYFGTGGALGFDTLAAQEVLELKEKYLDIRLILVLPCYSKAKSWSGEDISEYERIKANADKVVYISKGYTIDCMFKRNRHLVNNSSLCICYLTRRSGGAAYTVSYARIKNLAVENVAYKK